MRYYQVNGTLIVRGAFRALTAGSGSSARNATSFLIHPSILSPDIVREEWEIEKSALQNGLSPKLTIGLINSGPVHSMSICRYDRVTIFFYAGTSGSSENESEGENVRMVTNNTRSISIICIISGMITDQDLLDVRSVLIETRKQALMADSSGSIPDSGDIIIGCEETKLQRPGEKKPLLSTIIPETIRYGISEIVTRNTTVSSKIQNSNESHFFIHTSIGGEKWIEWQKRGCPYYPCHFKGQRCDLCYCPLYPCEDENLGEWTSGSRSGGQVWSCAPCTLNHQPAVVRHLRRNPEASVLELKSLLCHSHTE